MNYWFFASNPTQVPTARQYIGGLLRFLAGTASVMLLLEFLICRWRDVEFRPVTSLLFVSMMAVYCVIGAWWQLHSLRRKGDPSLPKWPQFSLRELFILMTLLSICGMFAGIDFQQRQWEPAAFQRLSEKTAALLGTGGGVRRNSDGLVITIAEPTFDDESFAELAKLIHTEQLDDRIKAIIFNVPPNKPNIQVWTGVTDQSLKYFLNWPNAKQFYVDGTSISLQGRRKLAESPRLEKWSKDYLLDTRTFVPAAPKQTR
jgi:hypothetical protein